MRSLAIAVERLTEAVGGTHPHAYDASAVLADVGDLRLVLRALAEREAVERYAARAWDQGRAAERRDWEFAADLATPDEDRQPWTNPYRAPTPAAPRVGSPGVRLPDHCRTCRCEPVGPLPADVPVDPYCPEHGTLPTAYSDCSCFRRADLVSRPGQQAPK